MDLYERIKILCEENNEYVTSLCKEITGSSGNLPTWQKNKIWNYDLIKIAKRFCVSIDYLLGLSDRMNESPRDLTVNEEQLLDDFRALNHQGQELTLQVVDSFKDKYKKDRALPGVEASSKIAT